MFYSCYNSQKLARQEAKDKMPKKEEFPVVFDKLKGILQDHAANLTVKADEPGNYYLETRYLEKYKKELFVGAVQIKKNYVSLHLFPVYMFPDLLENIPA